MGEDRQMLFGHRALEISSIWWNVAFTDSAYHGHPPFGSRGRRLFRPSRAHPGAGCDIARAPQADRTHARYARLPFFLLDVILPANGRLRPDSSVGDHVASANGSCVG